MDCYHYNIAGHNIRIRFGKSQRNGVHLIPSFEPFRRDDDADDLFFSLDVDDNTRPMSKEHLEFVGTSDNGNGETRIGRISDGGGYQYIIKDVSGRNCCLLQASEDFTACRCALNGSANMRRSGLASALMIIYALRGSYKNTLLLHASLVRHKGLAYAFIAKSGTGKSTQVSSWLRHIEGCDLMNDDSPIVRIEGDKAYIYGSPWSGKTPCYRKTMAELAAITKIERSERNSIEAMTPISAFAAMLQATSTMRWNETIFNNTCSIITGVMERVRTYTLHCLPDKESALLCHQTISSR